VRGTGEHGELGLGKPGEIAHHAAAEQPEQLDRVLGADGVGVPDDEQGGRGVSSGGQA